MHSIRLSELGVIKSWGRLPSEFGLCSPERNLAFMMAHDLSESVMQSYDVMLQEIELDRARRKNG